MQWFQGTEYFSGMGNPTVKDFWVHRHRATNGGVAAEIHGIVVNPNEIVVGTKSAAPTTSEPSHLPIDLTAFEGH